MSYSQILPFIFVFVIFYFMLIRPQQQRQKKHQQMLNNLNVNDSVVTAGGIMGTIVKIKDKSVVIKAIDNTKFEVMKSHISYVDEAVKTEVSNEGE